MTLELIEKWFKFLLQPLKKLQSSVIDNRAYLHLKSSFPMAESQDLRAYPHFSPELSQIPSAA